MFFNNISDELERIGQDLIIFFEKIKKIIRYPQCNVENSELSLRLGIDLANFFNYTPQSAP